MLHSAGAIIITHDNRILLQRRDDRPGLVNPRALAVFGGFIEGDEEPRVALARELKEELGAEVAPDELQPICQRTWNLPDQKQVTIHHFLWRETTPRITGVYEGTAAYFNSVEDALASEDRMIGSARYALEQLKIKMDQEA